MKKEPKSIRPSQPILGLLEYDLILVAFSGGKDSMACLLWLLEQGVLRSKIELHHHLVDGKEDRQFMDWPITEAYCRAVGEAFNIPCFFSWKREGFEGEMTRDNDPTAEIIWEHPVRLGLTSSRQRKGGDGPPGTRHKFPQVSVDLSQRWCSAYLKIDVMSRMLNNDLRFQGKRILVLSGERGEESAARACYAMSEPDRSDNRNGKRNTRMIDRIRPIRDWKEAEVWQIIEHWRVQPHPCYMLGFGRCSCAFCIFFSKNQACTARKVLPEQAAAISQYEAEFGMTIKRKGSFDDHANAGEAYAGYTPEWAAVAAGTKWPTELPIILENWALPAGAFGESAGPV